MTQDDLKKLIPDKSYIKFAEGVYMVAGFKKMAENYYYICIYDEPPSYHIDWLNPESCQIVQ